MGFRRTASIGITALAVVTMASCGGSSGTAADSTVKGAGSSTPATSSASGGHPSGKVAMPTTGCVLSDGQASALLGSTVTGTSTTMPGGFMCRYSGDSSGGPAMSVSVKRYPSAADAEKIVKAMLSGGAPAGMIKSIEVGDVGASEPAGGLARFAMGDVQVEILISPADKALQAAQEVAAKL